MIFLSLIGWLIYLLPLALVAGVIGLVSWLVLRSSRRGGSPRRGPATHGRQLTVGIAGKTSEGHTVPTSGAEAGHGAPRVLIDKQQTGRPASDTSTRPPSPCPACAAATERGVRYCTACGSPLPGAGSTRPRRDERVLEQQLEARVNTLHAAEGPDAVTAPIPVTRGAPRRSIKRGAVVVVALLVLATVGFAGAETWRSGSTEAAPQPPLLSALPGDPTCPLTTATLAAMGQRPDTNSAYHSEFDNSEGVWQGCAIDEIPHSDTGVLAYKVSKNGPSEDGRVRADPAVTVPAAPTAEFSESVTLPSKYSHVNGYLVQGLLPAKDGNQWYVSFSGYGMTEQQALDETNKIVSTLLT